MKHINAVWLFLIFLYCQIGIPGEAHAYLDPGSASIIIQTLLGLLLGISMVFKTIRYKVKSVWDRIFHGDKSSERSDNT